MGLPQEPTRLGGGGGGMTQCFDLPGISFSSFPTFFSYPTPHGEIQLGSFHLYRNCICSSIVMLRAMLGIPLGDLKHFSRETVFLCTPSLHDYVGLMAQVLPVIPSGNTD